MDNKNGMIMRNFYAGIVILGTILALCSVQKVDARGGHGGHGGHHAWGHHGHHHGWRHGWRHGLGWGGGYWWGAPYVIPSHRVCHWTPTGYHCYRKYYW